MPDDLSIPCSCGDSIPVTPGQAGTEVKCYCGRVVPVPGLAELRRMAGKDPYASTPAERIDQLEHAGKLVLPNECVECSSQTDGVLICDVCCEKSHATDLQYDWSITNLIVMSVALFVSGWVALYYVLNRKDQGAHGREVVCRTRLRVCPACCEQHGSSHATLVSWHYTVPIYAELFDMYPEAEITVLPERAK